MNNQKNRREQMLRWGRRIAVGLLSLGMLFPPVEDSASAKDEQTIRVAMFLDLGSTYRSTTPAVTLQSAGTLSVGPRSTSWFNTWIKSSSGEAIRISVDGFRVKALETSDWKTAASAAKKLQATSNKPTIFVDQAGGSATYQVYTGMYASATEATQAVASVKQTLAGELGSQVPVAKGEFYGSAGVYKTKAEAEALRQQIIGHGFDAWLALTNSSTETAQYEVWVGETLTESQLTSLQSSIQLKLPTLQIKAVDSTRPALILSRDVTNNLITATPLDHFILSGNGAKLWVQGNDDSVITVTERSNRKYRGSFEISKVNGQLALVNELPLEKYLYSVVGGEVSASWPMESLKAQAVAARSYALYQGVTKFRIASVVDSTLSQVYNGTGSEAASVIQAVNATAGEVMKSGGKIIEGVFSSNSGGMTADPSEVWKSTSATYAAVASSEDKVAAAGLKQWYHVLLSNGQQGYVREDYVKLTGKATVAGLKYMTVTTSKTAVRPIPMIQSGVEVVASMSPGDQAVVLGIVEQSNTYSWIRGPFTSGQLLLSLKGKVTGTLPSSISNIEVTQRGPSGRATEVQVNGTALSVKYPDLFRSALGGLPSTKFDIAPTGRYTVLGAGGTVKTLTPSSSRIISASGQSAHTSGNLVIMNNSLEARSVDQTNNFLFIGQGNGHGLGMSQWGAKGMADAGYDYSSILQHYYKNVTITKE